MKVYIAFKLVNHAETWRDPDDIKRTDLGVYGTLKKAKDAVFNEINKFCLKNERYKGLVVIPKWRKCTDEKFPDSIYFEETGSWAPTYIIQKENIK